MDWTEREKKAEIAKLSWSGSVLHELVVRMDDYALGSSIPATQGIGSMHDNAVMGALIKDLIKYGTSISRGQFIDLVKNHPSAEGVGRPEAFLDRLQELKLFKIEDEQVSEKYSIVKPGSKLEEYLMAATREIRELGMLLQMSQNLKN